MQEFLVHFTHQHLDFRLPELQSLAKVENVELECDPSTLTDRSPFFVVRLNGRDEATRLIRRSILIKEIIELWAESSTMDGIVADVASMTSRLEPLKTSSFKFIVGAFGATLTMAEQVERMEKFGAMKLEGAIDMKNPDIIFRFFEDHGQTRGEKSKGPERYFFGTYVAEGNRNIVAKFDVKQRSYIGTTTMDAELSLIMANQALARPGSIIMDPFVGTGSFVLTCAHFGSYTIGADIDGRKIRGKEDLNMDSNVQQYGLQSRVLGNVVSDNAHHPWRRAELWDAIVCDPPYSIREGAKRIGRDVKLPPKKTYFHPDGNPKLPQTVPYDLPEILVDLLEYSAERLVLGGRLVFWFPTVPDEYKPDDIPRHPRLQLIANSEQNFGKWARRLITMEKLAGSATGGNDGAVAGASTPTINSLRTSYFSKQPVLRKEPSLSHADHKSTE